MIHINIKAYGSGVHIQALDGLRGIAILLVLLNHCFKIYPFQYLSNFGWVGVDLFFVLSGFLITGILLDTKGEKGFYKNFIIKRILRIFPLYYFFLIIFFSVVRLSTKLDFNQLFSYQAYFWTYTQNIFYSSHGWPNDQALYLLLPFWSLAVEEQFYLFWPLLIGLFNYKNIIRIILTLLALCIIIRNVYPVIPFAYVFTLAHMDGLLVGSMICVLMRNQKNILERWIVMCSILAGLCLTVLLLINHELVYFNPLLIRAGYTFIAILFGGFLSMLFATGKVGTFSRNLVEKKIYFWLGKYSYGIYIYHYILYNILFPEVRSLANTYIKGDYLNDFLSTFIVLIIILLVSYLSYHLFEKHFLKLKRRFKAPYQVLSVSS